MQYYRVPNTRKYYFGYSSTPNSSYKIIGGNKKSKTALKINSESGKITVKKKTKKGSYTVTVKVTAAGNDQFNAGSKDVKVTVKVK